MNQDEVNKEQATDTGSPAQPKPAPASSDTEEGGVDFRSAVGTIAVVTGDIVLFTGVIGASIVVLSLLMDPFGIWAIPLMLGTGLAARSLGVFARGEDGGSYLPFGLSEY